PDAVDMLALWDVIDGVYRCPQCKWELEGGVCSIGCQLEFGTDHADEADYTDTDDEADYTGNDGSCSDHATDCRSESPLPGEYASAPSFYAKPGGQIEYEELRRRGATRLMCETFNLEFSSDTGIIAWADDDIYTEFARPLMQRGDFWKIMLGTRVRLDEDDPDGSAFVEALLEDALVFPLSSGGKWETVEESPGIWVTR
ncbi:hypothetical protein DFH06DRAFT_923309, partial [Mycena polygramma]